MVSLAASLHSGDKEVSGYVLKCGTDAFEKVKCKKGGGFIPNSSRIPKVISQKAFGTLCSNRTTILNIHGIGDRVAKTGQN